MWKEMSGSSWNHVYCALIVLRCYFALYGQGYVHPDEFFQNGEINAGQIFGLHILRTWEWDSIFPCRSIIPGFVTTGIPFGLLRVLSQGGKPSPTVLFSLERAAFLLLSFALDYCVYRLIPAGRARLTALILLASSHVLHTFQIRPFSNSIEAVLVAVSLVTLQRLLITSDTRAIQKNGTGAIHLTVLAVLLVCGVFTRLTFVAFALPIGLEALMWTLRQASVNDSRFFLESWARLISLPLLVAIATACLFTVFDTLYFPGDLSRLTLTPLNFLLYNLSSANLAEHGLHPRWLHLAVNLPMIVGPGLLYYGVVSGAVILRQRCSKVKAAEGAVQIVKRTSLYIIITSVAILSIQPHQEPRFLTPLLVPFIVLSVQSGRIKRAGKLFWIAWILLNVVMTLLFGVLHQGGVVPSLFYLNREITHLGANTSLNMPAQAVDVFYWKTYMPPRHLLGVSEQDVLSGTFRLTDLAGATAEVLTQNLIAPPLKATDVTTFLVTPPHALQTVSVPRCFSLQKRIFPHLDLDHIQESLEVGWKDGLSLGVYVVDTECVRRHHIHN